MRTAQLVEVRSENTTPAGVDQPRCATCRFVHSESNGVGDYLTCGRVKDGSLAARPRAIALLDGKQFREAHSVLHVSPNFGCVQWEGRE